MKISVVIPNWNGRDLLERNLPQVLKACQAWKKTGWEVIVVDDASTDDSLAFLKKKYPRVKLVVHRKNRRFAVACNSGVKTAQGEIVVLLNNDVAPQANFLEPLLRHFKDGQVFSVGCKERSTAAGRTFEGGRGLGGFKRGFLVHWRAKDQNKTSTLWTTGGSMAVDREKWLQLGGMDSLYRPAYWEDIDLSWRARKKGWKVLFEPQSVVFHQHETTNVRAFGQKEIKVLAYKNQFLFVWKNGGLRMIFSHFFWLPYHLVKTLLAGDFLFWQGFFLALKQMPEAVLKRDS